MARSPAKVSVECPHCGFKQMEYAAAKSTLCRQCGKHFLIEQDRAEAAAQAEREAAAVPAGGMLRHLGGFWNRSRVTTVACYDCGATQELNSAATSTICPSCSVHMDLRDYRITASFSRIIRTHGEVHVTSSGDLSSSQVMCRSAIIDGKLRGSLQCAQRAEFRGSGKMQGKMISPVIVIGKKAHVQFFRQVQVGAIEIFGAMTGEILADTIVTIRKSGSLDGNVIAKAINVEKGGTFTGQLVIGRQTLEQAELIPPSELTKPLSPRPPKRQPGYGFGLPAES